MPENKTRNIQRVERQFGFWTTSIGGRQHGTGQTSLVVPQTSQRYCISSFFLRPHVHSIWCFVNSMDGPLVWAFPLQGGRKGEWEEEKGVGLEMEISVYDAILFCHMEFKPGGRLQCFANPIPIHCWRCMCVVGFFFPISAATACLRSFIPHLTERSRYWRQRLFGFFTGEDNGGGGYLSFATYSFMFMLSWSPRIS